MYIYWHRFIEKKFNEHGICPLTRYKVHKQRIFKIRNNMERINFDSCSMDVKIKVTTPLGVSEHQDCVLSSKQFVRYWLYITWIWKTCFLIMCIPLKLLVPCSPKKDLPQTYLDPCCGPEGLALYDVYIILF